MSGVLRYGAAESTAAGASGTLGALERGHEAALELWTLASDPSCKWAHLLIEPLLVLLRRVFDSFAADGTDPDIFIATLRAAEALERAASQISVQDGERVQALALTARRALEEAFELSATESPPWLGGDRLQASRGMPAIHPPVSDRVLPIPPAPQLIPVVPAPGGPAQPVSSFAELRERVKELGARAAQPPKAAVQAAEPETPPLTATQRPVGFAPDPLPRLTQSQWQELVVSDCFTDVTALWLQRTPQLGDLWSSMEGIEGRLAANLDALRTLDAGAYQTLPLQLAKAPVVDGATLSALALVAGSVWGRDLYSLLERTLYGSDHEDSVWEGVTAALSVSASPAFHFALRRMLGHTEPRRRRLALRTLGALGALTPAELEGALRDRDLPLSDALEQFQALDAQQAEAWLTHLVEVGFDPQHEVAWAWQAVMLGMSAGLRVARERCANGTNEEFLLLLGIAGDSSDAAWLLDQFAQKPLPALARALGWAGLGRSLPFLINALALDDKALKGEAAQALVRITGANLYAEVEVAPELVMVPDVPEPGPKPEGQLAKEVSDPRDQPEVGSPDKVWLPSEDRDVWWGYYEPKQAEFHPERRYRCGQPAHPMVLVTELEQALRSATDRELIHRELTIRTAARHVRFSPAMWVSAQRVALEHWKATAQDCRLPAGTWERTRNR
jgi:hypothetical protein